MKTKPAIALAVSVGLLFIVLYVTAIGFIASATYSALKPSGGHDEIQTESVEESDTPNNNLDSFLSEYSVVDSYPGQTSKLGPIAVESSDAMIYGDEFPILSFTFSNYSGDGQSHESLDLQPMIFVKGSNGVFEETSAWGGGENSLYKSSVSETGVWNKPDQNGNIIQAKYKISVVAGAGEEVAVVATEGSEAVVIYYTIGE